MDDVMYRVSTKLMDLYCYNKSEFFYMKEDGRYAKSPFGIGLPQIFEHLDGGHAVSVKARKVNTVFMCFDVDTKDADVIRRLICAIEAFGIPKEYIYVSTSGGKGYHVEIFFDRPCYNTRTKQFFYIIIEDAGLAAEKIEWRPTKGQAIKMPLGVNHKTGNRCWYVDRDTLEPIEDFEYIFCVKKFSADRFEDLIHRANKIRFAAKIAKSREETRSERSRYPGMKLMDIVRMREPMLAAEGERHSTMLKIATAFRSIGCDEERIERELISWYHRQRSELIHSTPEEVECDAHAIAAGVMKFPVKVKPIEKKGETEKHDKVITRREMDAIMAMPTKTERRIAFLIYVHCKLYGSCCLGYESIGKIVGCSRDTVIKLIKDIIDRRFVEKSETGGVIRNKPMANVYKILNVETGGESVVITTKPANKKEFDDLYYGAICRLFDKREIKTKLTRTEVKENMQND